MDKAEYRIMLDQINEHVDAGDYAGALPIVEGIDWRRVKSVRTLCMVSEIYETNDRLEDSYRVLKIAYRRASISKTVLYRLAETSAKLGNYKEAIAYYREFEEVSPMDSSKYILKYEIYKAKGAPIENLIEILEAYKEREYTEQWAYELAKLYSEAGMKDSCVEACDDLILWFSEGAYVKGAMELKKKYVPLSASQSKKYHEMPAYKTTDVPKNESNEDLEKTEKEPVKEPVVQRDPARMQNQLADSIRAVFSGISRDSEIFVEEEADVEDDVKIYNPIETDMSGYEIKDLEPEAVEGKLNELQPMAADVSEQKEEAKDSEQIAGQMSFTDFEKPQEFDLEALIAETTSALAQEVASGEFHMTDEELVSAEEEAARKAAEEEAARKAAAEEAARKAAEEEAARKAAEEEAARKVAEEEAARKAAEEEAARKAAEEEAARKAAEEEAACKAAEEEAARKAAEEEAARKAAEEETARKVAEEVARETEKETNLYEKETDETLGLTREFNFNEELKKTVGQHITEDTAAEEEITIDEVDLEDLERLLQESATESEMDVSEEAECIVEGEELPFVEEEKRFKYVPVEPRELTEKEKEIFSYFTKIPGMSQQITETICDVHNNAGDKTSRSGNFLIIGRQGSGKTRLYECMVLAICNDLEIKAAKMAKIIGRDLNKKDPIAIVSKLSGGFLVIEGAGELNDETVSKLSQAMEFRTDSLVVVLEDEKADLYAMLDKHPELSEKFTSAIKIPVFTNDELVTFAKTYASENGYKMDEMGILALYTKISENQKNSEPVTVGKVKDIMDEAFDRANRGSRRLGRRFSKNSLDQDNRILLLEKDFD